VLFGMKLGDYWTYLLLRSVKTILLPLDM